MKQKPMYTEEIKVTDELYIKIDPIKKDNLILYNDHTRLGDFSLKRKMYTLFRVLQVLTNAENPITIKDTDIKLYAKPIHLSKHVYMQVSDEYFCLVVKFYECINGEERLLYMIAMNYITSKLFHKMLVPFKLVEDREHIYKNPSEFIEMLCIINYNKQYVS